MSAAAVLIGHALLAMVALPALAACLYLLVLTLLSGRLVSPGAAGRALRFDIIVPAHNEATLIARCLGSLHSLDWPASCYRIIVVADNCDDQTAAIARASGAHVLERRDTGHRGKGYALRHAFDFSRRQGWAEALVVVDADSEVSSNLLWAFAAHLENGAGVVQAHYGVLNAQESWRTSLMAIAHGAFHGVRSRARERLGLSCGLRGNGWCIKHRVLELVPYQAFSQTEDLEYGIALGLAGFRVHYAHEAAVLGDMESRETVAVRQRQRWEEGRFALVRSQVVPLLRAAIVGPSRVALDLALDLLVLPLSYVALNVILLLAFSGLASLWLVELRIWMWPGAFAALCLFLYVMRGWQLSGRGAAGLIALLRAPLFVLWKLVRVLRRHDPHEWAPTRRRRQ